MARKYKRYLIKTIKDWEAEYWDVYEEYKTQAGIMVYKGWPYTETPQNGGQANFYYILTNEIAEYITQHSIVHITKTVFLSLLFESLEKQLDSSYPIP